MLVMSLAKMVLFGIIRELQFRVCNHDEPCVSSNMTSPPEAAVEMEFRVQDINKQ